MFLGWLVPLRVLRREQQISDQWRQAAQASAAATDRQTEILRQLVAAVESAAGTGSGRHRGVG